MCRLAGFHPVIHQQRCNHAPEFTSCVSSVGASRPRASLRFAFRPSSTRGDDATAATELAARAVDFLRPRQAADGSWSGDRKEPGITALVVTAMLRSGRVTPDDPAVVKGLAYLERFVGPKGGLSEAPHSVYSTSVALMAFQAANKGGRFDRVIKGGQEFLKATQWDEGEGKAKTTLSTAASATAATIAGPTSRTRRSSSRPCATPACPPMTLRFKKALVFVSRCQNLKSEFNDQPGPARSTTAVSSTRRPSAAPRQRQAAKGAPAEARPGGDGALRSYAGMTYAGLKSMIYAGLTQDDPRVKAALEYIRKNYTLDENPGQGQRGLYYYYQTFAKAMALLGKPTIVDAKGVEHNWRAELVAALAKRQEPNGGWANRDDRFMEGDPNIVTSFGLLALAAARPKE